jgi:hypothetical protein
MSNFVSNPQQGEHRRSRIGLILLSSTLALSGCGKVIADMLVPDLACDKGSTDFRPMTYENVLAGDSIMVGHPIQEGDHLDGDVEVSLNEKGELLTEKVDRARTESHDINIDLSPDGKTATITADEQKYTVSAARMTDGEPGNSVHIEGECTE